MSKRDDIIGGTIRIINQEGIIHATIANILKEASTGYGTLYNYFDSKEDLLLAVYLHIIHEVESYVFTKGIEIGLEDSILRYLDYCLLHVEEFSALEALRTIPDICHSAKENSMSIQFIDLLEKKQADGTIQPRTEGYNIHLILSMISAFVNFYSESEIDVESLPLEIKKDFARSCLKALS